MAGVLSSPGKPEVSPLHSLRKMTKQRLRTPLNDSVVLHTVAWAKARKER